MAPSPAHGGLGCVSMVMVMADAGLCGSSGVGWAADDRQWEDAFQVSLGISESSPRSNWWQWRWQQGNSALEDELMVSGPRSVLG